MSNAFSFILELPLRVTSHDARTLDVRLDAGRQLYNACLGEALRWLDLMRESKVWKEARTCRDKDKRHKLFRSIQEKYCFSDYEIQAFAIKTKNACWIGDHLDTHTCQKIGTRAFRAVEQYAYGRRGRPRFKSKGRFRSLEGKSNATGIRFRDGYIQWRGLELKASLDRKDKYGVEAHGLSCETEYVRLVRKLIHGKLRWYAQLVQKGKAKLAEDERRLAQRRKAADAGGAVYEFPGADTRLSQLCHGCGRIEKKPLSNRASEAWPGAEPLLRRAVSRLNQTASGRLRFASFGLAERQSGSHVKDESVCVEAADVVGGDNSLSESRREAYT